MLTEHRSVTHTTVKTKPPQLHTQPTQPKQDSPFQKFYPIPTYFYGLEEIANNNYPFKAQTTSILLNHAQQPNKNRTGCSLNADSEEVSTKPHLNPGLLTVAASGRFLEEM